MTELAEKDRLSRERDFHDQLAAELDPRQMPPRGLNPLDLATLRAAGDLRNKRILDLGCGSGDFTVGLARAGAVVTGVDLSPGMVDIARRRVELYAPGAKAEFHAAPAEELPIESHSVDLIIGRFILHHLDIPRAAEECARVLATDGVALFAENSGKNPVLMLARDHLAGRFGIPRYGTEDERPLSSRDIETLKGHFPALRLEYPVFDFFTIFDRQVLRHRWPPITRLLRALDRAIWRAVPAARPWSFRTVVVAPAG